MFSYPITATFHADATPQAVWDAITGVERWHEVLPGVGHAQIEPPGRLEAGASIRALTGPQEAPVVQFYRVTVVEPPHRLTLESGLLRLQMFVVGRTLNKQREDALRERTRLLLTLAEQLA
jgi:hypothetical protein